MDTLAPAWPPSNLLNVEYSDGATNPGSPRLLAYLLFLLHRKWGTNLICAYYEYVYTHSSCPLHRLSWSWYNFLITRDEFVGVADKQWNIIYSGVYMWNVMLSRIIDKVDPWSSSSIHACCYCCLHIKPFFYIPYTLRHQQYTQCLSWFFILQRYNSGHSSCVP